MICKSIDLLTTGLLILGLIMLIRLVLFVGKGIGK